MKFNLQDARSVLCTSGAASLPCFGPHTFILGFLTSSNIQYSPWIFSNIQYFSGAVSQYFNIFLVFTNLTIILVVYTIEICFKKYLGGRGGASAPWHGATHAHAEGTPRVTARGLARFIASLQTLVARASARIRQYTIFVWASGSIFNIFVDLGLNIQYSNIKVCGPKKQQKFDVSVPREIPVLSGYLWGYRSITRISLA